MNDSREDSGQKRIPRSVRRGLNVGAALLFAAGVITGLFLGWMIVGVPLVALGLVLYALGGYLQTGDRAVAGVLIFVAFVMTGIELIVHFLGP
jgi:hypothetical protein